MDKIIYYLNYIYLLTLVCMMLPLSQPCFGFHIFQAVIIAVSFIYLRSVFHCIYLFFINWLRLELKKSNHFPTIMFSKLSKCLNFNYFEQASLQTEFCIKYAYYYYILPFLAEYFHHYTFFSYCNLFFS